MIYTERGWKVQIREKMLSMDYDRYDQNEM